MARVLRIEQPVVPTRPLASSKSGTALEGKCPKCGKWISLVHPTKTRPLGQQFHRHTSFRGRTCFGSPYWIPE